VNNQKRINDALNLLLTITKGSKKKAVDWIYITEETDFLLKNFGSLDKIARETKNSRETIRQIWSLNLLTNENKKRVSEKKILMDAGSRLTKIKDQNLQNKVGKVIENMASHDAREIIQVVNNDPEISIEKIKKLVINDKIKTEKEKIFFTLLPLEKNLYLKLKNLSIKNKKSLEDVIIEIIRDHLEEE